MKIPPRRGSRVFGLSTLTVPLSRRPAPALLQKDLYERCPGLSSKAYSVFEMH
ncbi:MAG: hypothetical protein OEN02_09340 [Gammaproteobacteria bacterium]|nr:hypothetical protein [Gammaproteobacteria bacterium]MDH3537526.1 hypothetical protein [Gammaproteobacteria bacterium]